MSSKRKLIDLESERNDNDLENKIKEVVYLNELTSEMIEYLLIKETDYLSQIINGEIKSWRNDQFFKNRLKREDLYFFTGVGQLSKSQQDVCENLRSKFENKLIFLRQKSLPIDGYIITVLLPELLIKITTFCTGSSRKDADKFISRYIRKSPLELKVLKTSLITS